MLNVMRDNLRHLKWVLWLVAVSMTLYLGNFFFDRDRGGVNADWAARVNGNPISTTDFFRVARQRDQLYRQILGEQYEQSKPQLQIGGQAIRFLIDQAIILEEAAKLGIRASDEEIRQQILNDPSFKGPGGNFIGREQYSRMVDRSWPGGVDAYEDSLANQAIVRKWTHLVTSPVSVTQGELLDFYRSRNDRTEIDYVVVASADQNVDRNVDDQTMRQWHQDHQENYRRPEGRKIRFVIIERQQQIAKLQLSDQDVETYYTEHAEEFTVPEQRRASHILIRVEPDASPEEREQARAKAEDALAKLRGGESFPELASTLSQDELSATRGGDLGFFGRGNMVAEFDKAVFETPVGEYAPVTETGFGFHVIHVTDERQAGLTPLDQVGEEIRRQLEQRRAEEMVESESARLGGQMATAAELDSVARQESLEVQERVVRRNQRLADLGAAPGFVDEIFSMAPGTVSEPLRVREGRALVAVIEEVPPDIAPLEEITGQVRADILNHRARTMAMDTARGALKRQGSLEKAARALDLEILKSGNVTVGRTLARTGGSTPELEEALFGSETTEGMTGVARVPAGALIYLVTKREAFDPAQFEASVENLEQEVLNQRRESLMLSILSRVRDRYQVEVNQELVNRLNI